MAKLLVAARAAGLATALALGGCNGLPGTALQPLPGSALGWYPPWTLNQSPERIALRWYPDATPWAVADQVAQLHCVSWNKSAVLVSDTRDGSAEIAEYHCH